MPSIKNRLINLRCFFTRIIEWGYLGAVLADPLRMLVWNREDDGGPGSR
ncbi:hypothetical protein ABT061_17355 [Streptosporangium sp. NPDC002544]